jgi:hypothetical protein
MRAIRSARRAGACSIGAYSRYVLIITSAVLKINRDFAFQVALNFDEAARSLSQPAREGPELGAMELQQAPTLRWRLLCPEWLFDDRRAPPLINSANARLAAFLFGVLEVTGSDSAAVSAIVH